MFSLSIFRLDFRLARWGSLSIGGGSRPAPAIYFLWIGDGRATPRLRLAARAPAPPLWVTLLCALRNCSASTIFAARNSAVTPVDLRSSRISFQGQQHSKCGGQLNRTMNLPRSRERIARERTSAFSSTGNTRRRCRRKASP